MKSSTPPNNTDFSVFGGVFAWSKILYEFFCLYDPKMVFIDRFRVFLFNHLMQIAHKILSYCTYKCNLHLSLVVAILGIIYNKDKIEKHGGD